MYKVLYRKWRPLVFADVVGQPQVTDTLRNELSTGRISHAYLLTGSRGTGKTTCAKILARAVNCLSPVDGDPCGECEICREALDGTLLDIVEIDAASNNGVDHIRTLREEATFMPSKGKYRVYIIDEVHMLSTGAFNALLKTLEEPPEHVVFILATTEVHKLPATILSRCQRLDFRRIPPAEIAQRLQYIADQEGATLTDDAALIIARLADGALRDALSLLDQCFGVSMEVTVDVVNNAVGVVGREHLYRLVDAVSAQDCENALAIIDELHSGSKSMVRLGEELCSYLRDIMLFKTMKKPETVLTLSSQELASMATQAEKIRLPFLIHCIDTMQAAMEKMSRGADGRLTTEMAMVQLCSPELDTSTEAVLRRLDIVERDLRAVRKGAVTVTEVPKQEEAAPQKDAVQEKASAPAKPAKKMTAEELSANAVPFEQWQDVLDVLGEMSTLIPKALSGSFAYESGRYILIEATTEFALDYLRKKENLDKMKTAIRQVTGKEYSIGPYKKAEKQQEKDPLQLFAEKAEQAGIEVIKK